MTDTTADTTIDDSFGWIILGIGYAGAFTYALALYFL